MALASVLNIHLYLAPPDAIFIYIVYLDMEHLPPWLRSHGSHGNLSTNICISMGGGGSESWTKESGESFILRFCFKSTYTVWKERQDILYKAKRERKIYLNN